MLASYPPRPTQTDDADLASPSLHATVGTLHVPLTLVKVTGVPTEDEPTAAYPAQFALTTVFAGARVVLSAPPAGPPATASTTAASAQESRGTVLDTRSDSLPSSSPGS